MCWVFCCIRFGSKIENLFALLWPKDVSKSRRINHFNYPQRGRFEFDERQFAISFSESVLLRASSLSTSSLILNGSTRSFKAYQSPNSVQRGVSLSGLFQAAIFWTSLALLILPITWIHADQLPLSLKLNYGAVKSNMQITARFYSAPCAVKVNIKFAARFCSALWR